MEAGEVERAAGGKEEIRKRATRWRKDGEH